MTLLLGTAINQNTWVIWTDFVNTWGEFLKPCMCAKSNKRTNFYPIMSHAHTRGRGAVHAVLQSTVRLSGPRMTVCCEVRPVFPHRQNGPLSASLGCSLPGSTCRLPELPRGRTEARTVRPVAHQDWHYIVSMVLDFFIYIQPPHDLDITLCTRDMLCKSGGATAAQLKTFLPLLCLGLSQPCSKQLLPQTIS